MLDTTGSEVSATTSVVVAGMGTSTEWATAMLSGRSAGQ